jgi:hypothetical protein
MGDALGEKTINEQHRSHMIPSHNIGLQSTKIPYSVSGTARSEGRSSQITTQTDNSTGGEDKKEFTQQ